jgi:hypothetical protein
MLAVVHMFLGWPEHYWAILVGGNIFWAILGLIFAGRNGNGCWGCLLGLIIGPLGLIIALLIPSARRL